MSIAATSATSAVAAAPEPAWSRELGSPLGMPSTRNLPAKATPADVKKAAGQFEAIILRQLLGPSIEPMMSGGLGGSGSGSGGGGGSVYGYMLTDTLCSSLGASGGLGIARMLEKQLAPPDAAPAAEDVSSPSK
jgi:peptidoglycan hydrolase FlgJ